MTVIIDTNVMLAAAPRKSQYNWLFQSFLQKKFKLAFSNEILSEYEERFYIHWHRSMAADISTIILEARNSIFVNIYFQFNLIIHDADDNKFADCAVAVSADYIITLDKHFNVLKTLAFPKINVVSPDEFKQILIDRNLLYS